LSCLSWCHKALTHLIRVRVRAITATAAIDAEIHHGLFVGVGWCQTGLPGPIGRYPSSREVELMSRRYTPYKVFHFTEKLDSLLFNEEGIAGLQQQDRP
jgi:hypothetical protein